MGSLQLLLRCLLRSGCSQQLGLLRKGVRALGTGTLAVRLWRTLARIGGGGLPRRGALEGQADAERVVVDIQLELDSTVAFGGLLGRLPLPVVPLVHPLAIGLTLRAVQPHLEATAWVVVKRPAPEGPAAETAFRILLHVPNAEARLRLQHRGDLAAVEMR